MEVARSQAQGCGQSVQDILLKMDDAQRKAAGVKGSPERALHDAQLRLIAETTGLAESDILDTFDAWLDGLSN